MKTSSFKRPALFSALALAALAASSMGLMEQKFGAVKGRVVGPDGQPVAGMVVRLVIAGPVRGSSQGGDVGSRGKSTDLIFDHNPIMLGKGQSLVSSAKTDDAGNFEMKKVITGKFKLVTNKTVRFEAANMDVEVTDGGQASVEVKVEAAKPK